MKAEVPLAEALGPAALLDRLALIEDDLRAAGRIERLELLPTRYRGRADRRVRVLTDSRLCGMALGVR